MFILEFMTLLLIIGFYDDIEGFLTKSAKTLLDATDMLLHGHLGLLRAGIGFRLCFGCFDSPSMLQPVGFQVKALRNGLPKNN